MDILKQINDEFDTNKDSNGDEFNPRWELLNNLDLKVGDWISWLYKEDYDTMKEWLEESAIRLHAPYKGLIIQLPDTEHFDLYSNAIVMITDYPCEKCYPEVTYVSMVRFLDSKDLYSIFKL